MRGLHNAIMLNVARDRKQYLSPAQIESLKVLRKYKEQVDFFSNLKM